MYINCCCCKICIWFWCKKSRETLKKERSERIREEKIIELKRLHAERKRLQRLLKEAEK